MASPFHCKAFLISIVSTVAFVLVASQDNVVQSGCEITSIKDVCDATLFPSSCYDTLSLKINSNITESPHKIFDRAAKAAMAEISKASLNFALNGTIQRLVNASMPNDVRALSAMESCRELLSLAIENLNSTFTSTDFQSVETVGEIKGQVCGTVADLQTCIDGFNDIVNINVTNLVTATLQRSTEDTSNCLAIIDKLDKCPNPTLKSDHKFDFTDDPYWLSQEDRKLLRDDNIKADIIVAKDGSGKYKTISDALKAVPDNSKKRFVIYVKKGVYYENVKVGLYKSNITMIGDGMKQTIVSGKLNYGDGVKTFDTATFAVFGTGFTARDMGFSNTAGPIKGQAVALLSTADKSVFYRCQIDGYQDTLYIHSNRQFYRECIIYGTIDFIFGYGTGVIQKSTIFARKPIQGQANVITGNQRDDPRCNTGFTIQKFTIKAAEDLKGVNTFLGRPLRNYSRVLFMQNYMDSLINPEGWLSTHKPPPRTLFFAEYQNKGPGANTNKRVKWPGVVTNLSVKEAIKYTVRNFINGDRWLGSRNVPYDLDL